MVVQNGDDTDNEKENKGTKKIKSISNPRAEQRLHTRTENNSTSKKTKKGKGKKPKLTYN